MTTNSPQPDLFDAARARFNGPAYDPGLDNVRLTGQIERIFKLMRDGAWRTLAEIESETGDGQASISAQLRHLRKARFGGHSVERQPRGDRTTGLYEYRLIVKETAHDDVRDRAICPDVP